MILAVAWWSYCGPVHAGLHGGVPPDLGGPASLQAQLLHLAWPHQGASCLTQTVWPGPCTAVVRPRLGSRPAATAP
eukprot:57764-Rhodomonas_salina.1